MGAFDEVKHDPGYGLLLKRYTDKVTDATEEQIQAAADDSIPTVWPLFWSFRNMVACGFIMQVVFGAAFIQTCRQKIEQKNGFSKPRYPVFHCLGLRSKQVGLSLNTVVNHGLSVKFFLLTLPLLH